MKTKFLLLTSCFLTLSLGINAQELLIDDFEGEAKEWNAIGDATNTVEANPAQDIINPSNNVLKVFCMGVEGAPYSSFSGPILNNQSVPIGKAAGQYRYAHVKAFYEKAQTCVLKLENGPDGATVESRWTDVGTTNQWIDLVFDLIPEGNTITEGTYQSVFIIAGITNSLDWYVEKKVEQTFYFDDITFSNDPNPKSLIPDPTDALAILENFESGTLSFTTALNDLDDGRTTFSIENNPDRSGINTSLKVLKMNRNENNTNAWAGFWSNLTDAAKAKFNTDKYPYARYKIYNDLGGAEAKFKYERAGDNAEVASETAPSKVNEWEEVIFDLGKAGATGSYDIIAIMPDFADNRPAHSLYIDDIALSHDKELSISAPALAAILNSITVLTDGDVAKISFRMDKETDVLVTFYNVSGQIIDKQIKKAIEGINETSVNIKDKGVYFVKITVDNKSVVSKFIR